MSSRQTQSKMSNRRIPLIKESSIKHAPDDCNYPMTKAMRWYDSHKQFDTNPLIENSGTPDSSYRTRMLQNIKDRELQTAQAERKNKML